MNVSDFDFDLPAELIAQAPAPERARLEAARPAKRRAGDVEHTQVSRLPEFLREGDLLVVNDTKVFPARLLGTRVPSGGAVECLLLANLDDQARSSDSADREVGRARASGAEAQPARAMIFRAPGTCSTGRFSSGISMAGGRSDCGRERRRRRRRD